MVGEDREGAALGVALGSVGMGCWQEAEWGHPVGEGRLWGSNAVCCRKEVTRQVSGSRQRRSEGGGRPGGVSAPGERALGCSWLLTGAINLKASGDLDAWHS